MGYEKLAIFTLEVPSFMQESILLELGYACVFLILSLPHLLLAPVVYAPVLYLAYRTVIYRRLSSHWHVYRPVPAEWTCHHRLQWHPLFLVAVVLE